MPLHRTFQERFLMAQVMQIPHVTHKSPALRAKKLSDTFPKQVSAMAAVAALRLLPARCRLWSMPFSSKPGLVPTPEKWLWRKRVAFRVSPSCSHKPKVGAAGQQIPKLQQPAATPDKPSYETNSYCCTLPPLHQGHVACFLSSVKELLWLGASVEWPSHKPLTRKAAVNEGQQPIQRINVSRKQLNTIKHPSLHCFSLRPFPCARFPRKRPGPLRTAFRHQPLAEPSARPSTSLASQPCGPPWSLHVVLEDLKIWTCVATRYESGNK